jgi:putative ABC transport system permease protein
MWTFRRRREDDFAREIETHLAIETDRLVADGMSPDAARRAAQRRFGNATHARERFYESRRLLWFDDLFTDARHAWHALRRSPGFAAIAIVTLALGIGANTAMFSIVNAVLLRPLPFADASRLVRIVERVPAADRREGRPPTKPLPPGDYEILRASTRTLSHVAGFAPVTATVTGLGDALRLDGLEIGVTAFEMLGAQPLLGRPLLPRDQTGDAAAVIVLSFDTWREQFAGQRDVIGRTIAIDGRPTQIVGVMQSEFSFPDPTARFWVPHVPPVPGAWARTSPAIIARLGDGISMDAVEEELNAILRRGPDADSRRIELTGVQEDLVAPVKPALLVLSGAVGLLLIIACVNVAHLLLARTALRQPEIAVRLAIGAGRSRIIRQLLTESVVLASIGALAGVALAFAAVDLLQMLAGGFVRRDLGPGISLPRLDEITVDLPTLAFTAGVAVATGILFGLSPALQGLSTSLTQRLRRDSGRTRLRELLVAAETAMAMVVLIGGGLLVHSFVKLVTLDPGYDPARVLTFQAAPERATPPRAQAFSNDLLARLESLPGVLAAGYGNTLPLIKQGFARDVSARPLSEGQRPPGPVPQMHTISRGLLDALGLRIVEGRALGRGEEGRREALVNRALVRSGLLGEDPIGRRLYSTGDGQWDVVGVVEDVSQFGLEAAPAPQIYVVDFVPPPPGGGGTYFAVRTDGDARAVTSAIRSVARQIDPNATITNVAMMTDLMWHSLSRQRLYAVMMGIFAAVSATLAAIGIFGVVACAVTQRTREIGIRMALGARPRMVLRLVVRQTALMTLAGMAIGVAAAAMLSRYLQGMLFGLTTLDGATFAAVVVLFACIAVAAAYAPASRATTLDPVIALRTE